MKFFALLTVLLISGIQPALAQRYECKVLSAVYKSPGQATVADALESDPTLRGSVFFVDRPSGKITGSSLFDNTDNRIAVIRDVNEVIDYFVVSSLDLQSDLRVLSIKTHEGRSTFTFYVESLGLFITGECKKT